MIPYLFVFVIADIIYTPICAFATKVPGVTPIQLLGLF